ncbi:MAG: valine--tRNA ligase [Bacteroidales bacterium]|nr:valine--tRNA ligase [Bacteroidales bacterium]
MENNIPKQYSPAGTESAWYDKWVEAGYFKSEPDDRQPYSMVIPPPNVTGVLHMGHMLNNTIQDVLVRRARMQGLNTLWLPGTDHASIATEAKVVNKLTSEGIDKKSLSREEFLSHAWEWKEKHGGIILEQLKKLGASCDWDRTRFTMDETLSASVIRVFIDLYEKGLIYRGVRMVNWDPKALTALSDEEVVHKEVQSKFYYVRYFIEDSDEFITIATTRPETILGDTAICIHPDDDRYRHFIGKKALVPLINRPVPFILDEYVDREFGTGALKVTPAHDINDYNLGLKHNLPSIDIFNDNGTLSEAAEIYIGEDRFVVREKISKELEDRGHLIKVEEITNSIGYSERTDEVIEPKLSLQWFLRMEELAGPALEVVMNDTVKFHPPKFKNIYKHWMENVRDWCISRQLWWGHRIPAYYLPDGRFVVAESREAALIMAREKYHKTLRDEELIQDEDVLDTWFSSWLWPISVFDGINKPNNPEISYYYPTNDLVTAPEILFFWVARMIMAGLEFRNAIPFRNVYLHGIVRDKQGRKMSKSLGNSPDPLELIDSYGADGVRVGMLLCSPAGNDLLFDESLCQQGRNFCNKIWNAFRLTQGWEVSDSMAQPTEAATAIQWFEANLNKAIETLDDHFIKFRIADALMTVYKLIWDDFCSWYLEMVKPAYQTPIDAATYNTTIGFLNKLMRLLHPFMPFISEEIYQRIKEDNDTESITIAAIPGAEPYDKQMEAKFDFARRVIMAIRNLRQEKNIPPKESIELFIKKNNSEKPDITFDGIVKKLCNISNLGYVTDKPPGCASVIVKATELYVPIEQHLDTEEEQQKLMEELHYQEGFLKSVEKKLSNERFVNNAPGNVVALERKKRDDAVARIKVIREQLENL